MISRERKLEIIDMLADRLTQFELPFGLCREVKQLYRDERITSEEVGEATLLLIRYRPRSRGLSYWWPPGWARPRIKFLKQVKRIESNWLLRLLHKIGLWKTK